MFGVFALQHLFFSSLHCAFWFVGYSARHNNPHPLTAHARLYIYIYIIYCYNYTYIYRLHRSGRLFILIFYTVSPSAHFCVELFILIFYTVFPSGHSCVELFIPISPTVSLSQASRSFLYPQAVHPRFSPTRVRRSYIYIYISRSPSLYLDPFFFPGFGCYPAV